MYLIDLATNPVPFPDLPFKDDSFAVSTLILTNFAVNAIFLSEAGTLLTTFPL